MMSPVFPEKEYIQYSKDLFLQREEETDSFSSFVLKKENTIMGSTRLIFYANRIIITGDYCPGNRGVVSSAGYGLDWFSSQLSFSYLCSKFLDQGWFYEKALEDLRYYLDKKLTLDEEDWPEKEILVPKLVSVEDPVLEREESKILLSTNIEGKVTAMVPALAWEFYLQEWISGLEWRSICSLDRLCEKLEEASEDLDYYLDPMEDPPGWGYSPLDAQKLYFIHRKFQEEYLKKYV